MRYFFLCIALFAVLIVDAQNVKPFEGEIHFKLEISGGGEETDLVRQFMPSGFVYTLKANNVHIKTLGNSADLSGNIVYNAKLDQAFIVQETIKTVYLIKPVKNEEEGREDIGQLPRVETGKTARTIAGYPCRHFVMSTTEEEGSSTEIWVTDDIQVDMPKSLGNNMPIDQKLMSMVKGFPLAMKMNGPNGLIIEMEAIKVEKMTVNKGVFDIPKGYESKPFEPMTSLPGGVE